MKSATALVTILLAAAPDAEYPVGPASALYVGDLKLVRAYESGALKLFDIAKDPGEHRDLAQAMPDMARALDARLSDILASIRAQMPSPNPSYDPNRPSETTLERKGKGGKKG